MVDYSDLNRTMVVRRGPDEPHPWLDARVEAEPGATVEARVFVQRPFRCDGIEGPMAAGWRLLQAYVGVSSQFVIRAPDGVPLSALLGIRFDWELADVGVVISLVLRNDNPCRAGLTIRLLGSYIAERSN
jgi:hypothetical protein